MCKESKPVEEFSWKRKGKTRHSYCKPCTRAYKREHYENNRQAYIDKAAKWKKNNNVRARRYGLEPEDEAKLIAKHDGKCWLCKARPAAAIDHDHQCCNARGRNTCGECIRGVLCFQCNSGLGLLGDNIEGLQAALRYLQQAKRRAPRGKRSSSSEQKKSS